MSEELTARDIQTWITTLCNTRCHYPEKMTECDFPTLLEIANGVGPSRTPWLTDKLNKLVPWMKPASLPHDFRWSHHMNRGSRDDFEKSNQEFYYNLLQLAKFYCADDDALLYLRRAEAWMAYELVSCGAAWNWYKQNANIEPGPERMG